ncbi:Protein of unknown function [Pyronema omphalodes CBS 100304]|uniref:Uncharacterized protein n=1 Tax=Pyronema omphalodes (strain CBS 100304) TaxID=1076935 RepID=U4LCI4_PYROM|nr:Protein of unknown function [Pyronema omphalodes CBS 100304]
MSPGELRNAVLEDNTRPLLQIDRLALIGPMNNIHGTFTPRRQVLRINILCKPSSITSIPSYTYTLHLPHRSTACPCHSRRLPTQGCLQPRRLRWCVG